MAFKHPLNFQLSPLLLEAWPGLCPAVSPDACEELPALPTARGEQEGQSVWLPGPGTATLPWAAVLGHGHAVLTCLCNSHRFSRSSEDAVKETFLSGHSDARRGSGVFLNSPVDAEWVSAGVGMLCYLVGWLLPRGPWRAALVTSQGSHIEAKQTSAVQTVRWVSSAGDQCAAEDSYSMAWYFLLKSLHLEGLPGTGSSHPAMLVLRLGLIQPLEMRMHRRTIAAVA